MVFAWRGLKEVYVSEQNFRLQLAIALAVVAVSFTFGISRKEWVLVLLLICMVLLLELVNTLTEKILDILKPKIHHYVEAIKNIMAAAVFLASLFALIIGVIIFLPYVIALFD